MLPMKMQLEGKNRKKKKKKEKIHTSDGGYIGKRWVAHIKCNLSFHTN